MLLIPINRNVQISEFESVHACCVSRLMINPKKLYCFFREMIWDKRLSVKVTLIILLRLSLSKLIRGKVLSF